MSELPRVAVGLNGYSEEQRAADFMAVFNGESNVDQGRRVYAQIADSLQPIANPKNADRPGMLAFQEGMRYALYFINRCMVVSRKAIEQDAPSPRDYWREQRGKE